MTEEKKSEEERPELVFRVKLTGRSGGVFEASASCDLEGHTFTGSGTTAGGEGGHAIAAAVAAVVNEMAGRWHRLRSFGGDVVIRKSVRALATSLDRLLRPVGVPPGWPHRPRLGAVDSREPRRRFVGLEAGAAGGPVTGELLDPIDPDVLTAAALAGDDDDDEEP